MFGIGGVEFILILLFVFIIFGADRLPEIARILGKAIAKFRKAQAEMNAAIQTDVKNLETDEQPFQKSVEAFDKFGKEAVSTVKTTVKDVQKKNAGEAPAKAGAAVAAAGAKAEEAAKETEEKPAAAPKPISSAVTGSTGTPLVSNASAANVAPTAASAPRRESFTERKARYEAERAARAAAEAAKAAAEAAPAPEPAAAPAAAPSGEGE